MTRFPPGRLDDDIADGSDGGGNFIVGDASAMMIGGCAEGDDVRYAERCRINAQGQLNAILFANTNDVMDTTDDLIWAGSGNNVGLGKDGDDLLGRGVGNHIIEEFGGDDVTRERGTVLSFAVPATICSLAVNATASSTTALKTAGSMWGQGRDTRRPRRP